MSKTGAQQQTQGTQSQQGTVEPWAEAIPELRSILAGYRNLDPAVTAGQTDAFAGLNTAISGLPNFQAAGTGAINNLFNSSTVPQVGMLREALGSLQGNLGGLASGAELDPYRTPGFADAIATMTGDITNRVKGVYAGSGRDPSGAGSFARTLGRGLTEGIAPTIAAQFNTNNANRIGAANTLFGAGNRTAGDITTQQQIPLTNATAGLQGAGLLQGLLTNPAQMRVNAATAQAQQPFTNMSWLTDPITRLAGLGGQTAGSGTSQSTTTQQQSLMSNIMGGVSGGIGLLSFLSDERAKENIEPVGELADEQIVYRYNYKGDPRVQIGLLAQEVAEVEPEAVSEIPRFGLLAVNYRKATDRAAEMRKAA